MVRLHSASFLRPLGVWCVAAVVCASGAAAQTATDGNSTFTIDPSATFANSSGAAIRTGTAGGSTALLNTGGITTTDHLFQHWWWYRVNGVTSREFALSNRTSGSATGNSIVLTYTEPEGFTATLTFTLTDGADAPPAANVAYTCELVNTSASTLNLALFAYTDFDVSNTAGSDSASLLEPGRIGVTDTATQATAQFLGLAPDAFRVTAFSTVRGTLADTAITNLDNTGLPFAAADFTAAYQWNLTIPAGGRTTVRGALALNQAAVPPTSTPTCPADFNNAGGITVQDIFDYLTAWFSNAPSADFNNAGGITVQDIFDYLTAWFSGCP